MILAGLVPRSSCRGVGAELVNHLVAEPGVGGGQGEEGAHQLSLGDPPAEQPANVQGELVEVNGGVGVEQDSELAR